MIRMALSIPKISSGSNGDWNFSRNFETTAFESQ